MATHRFDHLTGANPDPKAEPAPINIPTHDNGHVFVVCVYRTGKDYSWEYVTRLYDAVKRNLTIPFDFVCLTDSLTGKVAKVAEKMHLSPIHIVPLKHSWPGWWSKMELFRDWLGAPGARILYFDLDTVITGNIDHLASYGGKLGMLRNWAHPERFNSGVMAWEDETLGDIYHKFSGTAKLVMEGRYRTKGDQLFIQQTTPVPIDALQDFAPNQIESYKLGDMNRRTRVMCFHGKPRPHEAEHIQLVRKHWLGEN